MKVLFCIIGNAVSVACFTILAIHFGKWWIALFAIFFMASYTKKER